ncbi:hemerythrin domain-containing protein [Sphingomonas paeninsulae]|uniref:Hemerythrin domain-containing protein n=1 Tax=Sphingomonas paeninsulae TaxID=2319844 RepID=A0A494TEB2_SPHPE|nr:hemerythrin domain-containing protein [Sphingomonas paeninsulae]AYJ87847.1 hemerythrin domain-containing protein [Sphingomonas paeninsulae]
MATQTTERAKAAPKPRTTRTRANGSKSDGGSTGALIGAAAAGVALGVAAMIGRKVAVQAPTVLAGDWDDALAAEHAATLKIFDAIEATTRDNTTKRAILLAQLKHALAKHALQEENAVYPALRDAGEVEAADHLNKDHGYVKQYLYELTNCPRDSERFLEIVRKFRVDLEKHVAEEENTLFPSLKAKLSEEANRALTKAMNKEGFKLA